jgi:hypothetical protein
VVTIVVLPLHAFGHASEVFDGAGTMDMDGTVYGEDVKFLAGLEFEGFPDFLGDHDLKLRGDSYGFHGGFLGGTG